jgi:glutamine amidotransferase-like uncharacterized protein
MSTALLLVWMGTHLLSSSGIASEKPLALVYKGPGSCVEDCSESAAQMALQADYDVEFVWPQEINEEVLRRAKLWIQPGGMSLDVAATMEDEQKKLINLFVKAGGAYVGFCAGGFFADRFVHGQKNSPGLDLTPGHADDYHSPTTVLPIQYAGKTRQLFFQGGPYFQVNGDAQVLGTYARGEAAIIQFEYGLGRVAISGPHPEAPAFWRRYYSLHDSDGLDYDIALEMIRWAGRKN